MPAKACRAIKRYGKKQRAAVSGNPLNYNGKPPPKPGGKPVLDDELRVQPLHLVLELI
jgi:hypothetical protein